MTVKVSAQIVPSSPFRPESGALCRLRHMADEPNTFLKQRNTRGGKKNSRHALGLVGSFFSCVGLILTLRQTSARDLERQVFLRCPTDAMHGPIHWKFTSPTQVEFSAVLATVHLCSAFPSPLGPTNPRSGATRFGDFRSPHCPRTCRSRSTPDATPLAFACQMWRGPGPCWQKEPYSPYSGEPASARTFLSLGRRHH